MLRSNNTPPHFQELFEIGAMFVELLRSRPQDQSLSTLRSQVAFFRAKQNQRSKLAIQALPTVTSPPNQDEKCHICLEKFVAGKEVKKMGCKHLFHKECIIDKVLGVKAVASCSICGEKVPVRADKVLGEELDWDKLDDGFFQKIQSYVERGLGGSSA